MSIRPGARIGSYDVAELIGAGGMGSVYRAHDVRLDRDVALKVIHPSLAADPSRLSRFAREARLLASLTHPHIATIHGFEHSDDAPVLVMELVPGATLAERLREGPLPLADALTFGLQIASAIECAHDRGVIHRDLKPANIKITPAGQVKVLDFGLAKALATDATADALAGAPTLTSGGTGDGLILGTAAYMSPEQARGKAVDKRTDVWAFGCVLFDMLTGKAAFAGDTLSDVLAAVLTREPDWTLLPANAPPLIRRLLRRCLHKDEHRRLRDMGDVRLELEEALALGSSTADAGTAQDSGIRTAPAWTRHAGARLAGALLLGALASGAAVWILRPVDRTARTPAQFVIPLRENERLAGLDFPAVAISPAETHVAFVATRGGQQQLFVRPIASLESAPLPGTEGALGPFFSPDGAWIAFFAAGKLKAIPVGGGAVRTITETEVGFGGVWAGDNTIIYAPNNASALMRVSADGGTPQPVTSLDTTRGEFSHRWPDLLPDGTSVVFTVGTEGSWDDAEIVVQRLGSTERRTIVRGGTAPRVASAARLLYTRGGVLHALPIDAHGVVTGTVITDLADVMQSTDGAAQIAISRTGGLIYVPRGASPAERTLVWVDREGNVQPLAAAPRAYASPRLSPDGRTLVVTIGGDAEQVWTYDIAANSLTQLTFDGGFAPEWSRDGTRVIFAAARGGPPDLFAKPVNGPGGEERLTNSPKAEIPHGDTTDGGTLVVESDPAGRDVGIVSTAGARRALLATSANETAPAVSPDGRWLAYVSDASGQAEVYLAPLADPTRALQVSRSGGGEPVWRPDGEELFFRAGSQMMAASVQARRALSVQAPRALFTAALVTGPASRPAYDVSNDGMRFLMVRAAEAKRGAGDLRVLLGWRP